MRWLLSAWRPGWALIAGAAFAISLGAATAAAKETTAQSAQRGASDTLGGGIASYGLESIAAGHTWSAMKSRSYATAEELVARALAAEAAGDPDARLDLLRQALAVDSSYAPAHWQMSEIRVGDAWQTIEAGASAVADDGKAESYRQRRDQTGENADDQYRLAKWCGLVGLKDQERAHVLFALQLNPGHTDAERRFKQLKRLAEPAVRSEAEIARREAKQAAYALRVWRPILTKLRREVEARDPARRKAGLAELAAIKDLSALPAIESVFADADGELGSVVVNYLAGIDDQQAVDSLIRYSVSADNSDVRRDAADALQQRSMFSYVPTMMSILVPPTRMEFSQAYDVNGLLGLRLSLYQVGPVADVAYTATSTAADYLTVDRRSGRAVVTMDSRMQQERTAATIEMAEQVAATNIARQALNEKIAETLRVATGKKFDDNAESWWTWWLDHNEIYRLPEKPVLATMSLARISTAECFAPGTTVWTLSGPMPIERVKVGESVLSQKPSTGELEYKMVLGTTLRPSSPLVVIRAGNQTIRATRGHPFWVSGIGWQMAKELEAGQWLHAAHGPVKIASVEEQGFDVGHNLLIDGFNTYFVSDQLFLVHDNLIREVSPATVPGMAVSKILASGKSAAK